MTKCCLHSAAPGEHWKEKYSVFKRCNFYFCFSSFHYISVEFHMHFFPLSFSFLFVFICMPSICVAFKRPKRVAEGGQDGEKREEIVREEEEEVKQERLNENERGTEITETSNKEQNRESGDEEKAQDIPEQGKEKEQWNKEDLQRRFSQDDDR